MSTSATDSRSSIASNDAIATWRDQGAIALCPACEWAFLVPREWLLQSCPHCYAATLQPKDIGEEDLPGIVAPEAYLPFELSDQQVEQAILRFAQRVPLAPSDLKMENLQPRLQMVFLPRWLVDADVQATWRAEAGYDYDIVSHEERFEDNRKRWTTIEVRETRVRWESRTGQLDRRYHNLDAPAMEEDAVIRKQLGSFDIRKTKSYQAQVSERVLVRLPNRSEDDVWPDAQPLFYRSASLECQKASGADHLRDFQWSPQFSGRNWTQLLLPVYSTFYLDDDSKPRPVLIHGQTGQVSGVRRASQQRAKRIAIVLLSLAFICLLLGVGFSVAALWADGDAYPALSALLYIASLSCGIGAIIPPAIVWSFNRSQRERRQVF